MNSNRNETSNKKHFRKNVKECRDVIVEKVYKQGRDGSVTIHIFDLIAPYIVVTYIHCNGVRIVMFATFNCLGVCV